MSVLAGKETVEKLIPQRSPMVMIDTLISHEGQKTVSAFTIEKDNIFVQDGYFTEAGLIENMARTAALRTGWIASQEKSKVDNYDPPVGVIGAVKGFTLFRLPEVNTKLRTEISILIEVLNATVVKAQILNNIELLAEGELKIFIQYQPNT